MAWCKVSSLTAAISRSLHTLDFPASRSRILSEVDGVNSEGWDLSFFLAEALKRRSYGSLREVMSEVEGWLDRQG